MKRNKAKLRASKKAAHKSTMLQPGHQSKYARKYDYCTRNGVWGFEVPAPKPWA
jgi:hypothetical protein